MLRMTFGLNLEQTQKLIMTQELRQAITILQLSSIELTEYIENALLENPILEINEENPETETLRERKKDKEKEIDWEDYFNDSDNTPYIRKDKEAPEDEFSYENFVTKTPTLQEHLLFQLNLVIMDKRYKKTGEFLIGSLNRNGYLTCSIAEAARFLKQSEHEVEEVLKIIQTFDPSGVGARNLQECLLIQAEQRGINSLYLEKIIRFYLKELAQASYSKIAEALGISIKEVQKIKDIIQTLEPKPGRNFAESGETQYVVPDAVIQKVGHDYVVVINDATAPRLTINNYYKNLLYSESKESNIRKFLDRRLDSAVWLIKSIEQRRMTLYKVVKSIVEVQRGFFDYGISHLKPLTLKQIAEMVGVHESTVSRATNGKYVQTPRGVYELKFFFSSGIESAIGPPTSSESIKKLIEDMIKNEDSYRPLSDQQIANNLKSMGIMISRRTVAKYRDDLKILSSIQRKRY